MQIDMAEEESRISSLCMGSWMSAQVLTWFF